MNSKSAVMVAIGLILGLLAGLAVGSAMTGNDPARVDTPAEDFTADDRTPAEPRESPRRDPPPDDKPPATKQPPPSIADLIAAADIPAIPSGNATITGTVMTLDGRPVEGVTVKASSSYPERRNWQRLPAVERLEQEIRYAKWREESVHEVLTDADGRYRIAGLAEDVSYMLSAFAPGWSIQTKGSRVSSVKPPEEQHFLAAPQTTVSVRVEYEDGSVESRAIVLYRSKALTSEQSTHVRDEMAELRLTPGEWVLYAVSRDYDYSRERLRHRSAEVELTIEEGEPAGPLTLVLEPTAHIRGGITTPRGFGSLALEVYVQPHPPTEPPDRLGNTSRMIKAGVWAEDGSLVWRCSNLEQGHYRVLLALEDALFDWADVTLSGMEATQDLRMPQPSAEDYIILRVYSPDGELLRDADIRLTAYGGGRSSYSPRKLISEDGHIWLLRDRQNRDIEYDGYDVLVTHSKHGHRTVYCEGTSRDVLDIHLHMPAWIVLTVDGWTDHPGRHLMEWLVTRTRPDRDVEHLRILKNSQTRSPIRMGPFEPGDYELRLNISIRFRNTHTLMKRSVTLQSGDNAITETLPELHSLTIRAQDPESPPTFEINGTDGGLSIGVRRDDFVEGTCTIPCLPPGTYLLQTRSGEMEVNVRGATEVVFRPREYDCFQLTISPEGGRIEGLGLKNDDKLIEIDGNEIRRDEDQIHFQASLAKDSTTWVVLRNGVRTAVTFNGKALYEIMTDRDADNNEHLWAKRAVRD